MPLYLAPARSRFRSRFVAAFVPLALGLVAAACAADGSSPDGAASSDDLRTGPAARDLAALRDGAAPRDGAARDQAAAADLAGVGDGGAEPADLAASVPDLALAPDLAPPPPDLASPCGVCPNGYACGTANGIPACRAPSGIPLFSNVFVVVMENTSWSTLDGSGNTPYLHSLESNWAYSTNYHGVAHPSLPNYVAMVSGGTQGVSCDCDPTGSACNAFTCNALIHACGCAQDATHLGDQLDAANLTWRAYGESMGAPCNTTTSGSYATRHVPFLYFNDVLSGANNRCADHVVDYTSFATDLANAPRAFNFIAPDLTDDMHDPYPATSQNLANGDAFLAAQLPAILQSKAFARGGLVIVVWDEDDYSGLLGADDPVPLFVLSPLAKKAGYPSGTHADHYALLATIEDGLGLPRIGNAVNATPLADFFPTQ